MRRSKLSRVLSGLVLVIMALPSLLRADPLPEFTARYEISTSGFTIGESERSLRKGDNDVYLFQSSSRSSGYARFLVRDSVVERSWLMFRDTGLLPVQYYYKRSGGSREREEKVLFDWRLGKATGQANGRTWQVPLVEGALDNLVYQIAIMQRLARGERQFSLKIADDGRIKYYDIRAAGQQSVATPYGTFDTVMVARADERRDTILWCAERLAFLPVQIQHREKGGSAFVARLISLSGIVPTPVAGVDTRGAVK